MNPEQFKIFKTNPKFNKTLYDLGRIAEIEILEKIRIYFCDETIYHLPEGNQFDFDGVNKLLELKSRRVNRLTYEDTAIGRLKIETAKHDKGNTEYIFLFKYINGLYYWRYDPYVILREGYLNNILHYFIPVNILTKIP